MCAGLSSDLPQERQRVPVVVRSEALVNQQLEGSCRTPGG